MNPIRPVSPSYATSRLGIAETVDYLSNTDFHCISYVLVELPILDFGYGMKPHHMQPIVHKQTLQSSRIVHKQTKHMSTINHRKHVLARTKMIT